MVVEPSPKHVEGATQLRIEYYTDPLCVWSWAMEPMWRRLRFEFGNRIVWRYRMGGLVAQLGGYCDPLNDVSSPTQLGAHWFDVSRRTGMPVDERIWAEDPPSSSYPAAIAVKAAELQGAGAGERYLRRLREAVMLERRNIARPDVLTALAGEVGIDNDRFEADRSGAGLQAFRADIMAARYHELGRFPALILHPAHGRALLLVGWRPYPALLDAVEAAAPELEPERTANCAGAYARQWDRITAREVAEATGEVLEAVTMALDSAAEAEMFERWGGEGRTLFGARHSSDRSRSTCPMRCSAAVETTS